MDATAALVPLAAYLIGAVPVSYLVARAASGIDLREFGSRSVSGSNVWIAAGFTPMAVAGVLDIAKGALAVAFTLDRPAVTAVAAGCVVVGHNWSVFLRGAGGRGLGSAIGVTMAAAWPGTLVLGLGLVAGRAFRQTAAGSFASQVALAPVLLWARGWAGWWLGIALVVPMWVKRVAGAGPPAGGYRPGPMVHRLVRDHDRER